MTCLDDRSERRLASTMLDLIGDLGIAYAVYRIGRDAEGGWEIVAWDLQSPQHWTVRADRAYLAVCELAQLVGVELEDG